MLCLVIVIWLEETKITSNFESYLFDYLGSTSIIVSTVPGVSLFTKSKAIFFPQLQAEDYDFFFVHFFLIWDIELKE